MSYLDYSTKSVPAGWRKLLYLNWPVILLLLAVASIGFLMLYSVSGGSLQPWAQRQMTRFGLGMAVMFAIALVPMWFWRNMAVPAYIAGLALLLAVELFGEVSMGARRWLDLGFARVQPSEMMKVAVVMMLAAYYDWLAPHRVSRPLWVAISIAIVIAPTALILKQPDLGTAVLLATGGAAVIFLAGVHWGYFAAAFSTGTALLAGILKSRGTEWQMLKDYQYRRIDTFLDPSLDPLGGGYHITQSTIALGSGGWSGRGFLEGTQTQLNFLPEKHTDFIFTTLAEEFGFVGSISLLTLCGLVVAFCVATALATKDRFASLLSCGIATIFFLLFVVNVSMVTGLLPVVGVPLPLVSYGGSAMLTLMAAFGLVHSANIHRPR